MPKTFDCPMWVSWDLYQKASAQADQTLEALPTLHLLSRDLALMSGRDFADSALHGEQACALILEDFLRFQKDRRDIAHFYQRPSHTVLKASRGSQMPLVSNMKE